MEFQKVDCDEKVSSSEENSNLKLTLTASAYFSGYDLSYLGR